MRDLAFIGFLVALFATGFRRPFLFVLAYVYIDIVSPQRLTYYLLNTVPISLIAVGLAVGGWAVADDKRDTRVAPRQAMILLLLVYCFHPRVGVLLVAGGRPGRGRAAAGGVRRGLLDRRASGPGGAADRPARGHRDRHRRRRPAAGRLRRLRAPAQRG